jgi:23S rRNA pseudouridine1911/1915/1917 synthase
MERIMTVTIKKEYNGYSIKNLLLNVLGISHKMLVLLKKREQGIMLNNSRVFVTVIVKEGDLLTLMLEEKEIYSQEIVPTPGSLDIYFEDRDMLIVNKPANLPVHPSKGHFCDSLANIVVWYYKNRGEQFTFRAVNRLDSGTSGLMIIAKNAHIHSKLSKQIHTGELQREYIAIACGSVEFDEGIINSPIRRVPNMATIEREVHVDGDKAVTHYIVLKRTAQYTLLRLKLETGRTHQIRVHLASIGHPLLGDFLYGTECKEMIERHALHSEKITLKHPMSGEWLSFDCPIPEDMRTIIF